MAKHKHTHKQTQAKLSSGLEPDINDVPAAFNNYLFIVGVSLQCREPDEVLEELLRINHPALSFFFWKAEKGRALILFAATHFVQSK